MKKIFSMTIFFYLLFFSFSNSQNLVKETEPKFELKDLGKMWIFENLPYEYFKEEYNFEADSLWFDYVRKAALKWVNYCSASFVSEDGLIMTNHHCARGEIQAGAKEGEDFLLNGFYAKTLEEERKIPDIYVDQLIVIEDVTEEIHKAMKGAKSENEKIKVRDQKILEIESKATTRYPDLIVKVVSLYNGGRFSLYGYKRYEDIRLVFAPDLRSAKLGGDYDNFTYPRYGLDFLFFRAYGKDGKPIKTDYYFKWSENGPKENEPLFVIGNPGSTKRYNTIAQIDFIKDIQYPIIVSVYKRLYKIYEQLVQETDGANYNLIARLYSIGNGMKFFEGTLKSVNSDFVYKKKVAFEETFKSEVDKKPELKKKYGYIWKEIEESRKKVAPIFKEYYAYSLSGPHVPIYYRIAREVVKLSRETKLPEDQRSSKYRSENLQKTVENIYPKNIDEKIQKMIINLHVEFLYEMLGKENKVLKELFSNKKEEESYADYLLNKSQLRDYEKYKNLVSKSSDELLKTDDPFVKFILLSEKRFNEISKIYEDSEDKEEYLNQELTLALFEIYGDKLAPDATNTLRISDGVMKGYNYNGTLAPPYTTFYGLLDRHNSFYKKFPFNLSNIWKDLPDDFNLGTPLNFVSTNDIIGGNSGSPIINANKEIVGLIFDGNIESMSSRFLYEDIYSRAISVHSKGIIEAVDKLYKAKNLAKEILNGKIISN